jgi:hypothetical protein
MPCLLVVLALIAPRVVIVLIWLFERDWFQRAYDTWLWPVLGFFFMPVTTLAYAWAANSGGVRGVFWIVVMVIAVLIDLGSWEGGRRSRS